MACHIMETSLQTLYLWLSETRGRLALTLAVPHPLTGVNVVQGYGYARANRDNFKGGVTC